MPCGLYGKLPAKRDFVAVQTPRAFLGVWEPWVQGGLSASRTWLGEGWRQAYLQAPIWRFWLGGDLCGEAVLGAFMPSVDGVGRYYPLTLIGQAGDPEGLPPPEIEAFEAWFALAEACLLAALAEGAAFEEVTAELGRVPDPRRPADPSGSILLHAPHDAVRLRGGALTSGAEDADFADALSRLRPLDHARVYAAMTYWWTPGGEGFAPQVLASRRMPDPYAFTGMLTGRFDALGG